MVGALLVEWVLSTFGGTLLGLTADGKGVMGLVPLTEGGSVNFDDSTFYQGVGTDKLVVGSVVHDPDDTGLAGGRL